MNVRFREKTLADYESRLYEVKYGSGNNNSKSADDDNADIGLCPDATNEDLMEVINMKSKMLGS